MRDIKRNKYTLLLINSPQLNTSELNNRRKHIRWFIYTKWMENENVYFARKKSFVWIFELIFWWNIWRIELKLLSIKKIKFESISYFLSQMLKLCKIHHDSAASAVFINKKMRWIIKVICSTKSFAYKNIFKWCIINCKESIW